MTLLSGRRAYLDANIFIYAVEAYPQFAAWLTELFTRIDRAEIMAATSEMTLAELLVGPFREGNPIKEAECFSIVQNRPGLQVYPMDRDVLIEAARLRASGSLKLPDALHVASALQSGCEVLLTNDHRLRTVTAIQVELLSDVLVR
jgi:predicted nucleic acid-binding protein